MTSQNIKWPEMTEAQNAFCVSLIEKFKGDLKEVAEDVLNQLYTDVIPHLETDTFLNFKSHMLSAVQGYARSYALDDGDLTGRRIREVIYKDHKDELVKLIDHDNVMRITELEKQLRQEREYNRGF